MVKRIACYITCGWTECGAMQSFLNKINCDYIYDQRCPNKPKGRKGKSPAPSGLTGNSLLDYMYKDLARYSDELRNYSAIILEDDLDGRFHDISDDKKNQHFSEVQNTVNKIFGKSVPVIIFYASPEIEAWFLSDWKNTFGSIYRKGFFGTLTAQENGYFSIRFFDYIKEHILCEYVREIENYGFFNGVYRKLSSEIENKLKVDFRQWLKVKDPQNQICEKIIEDSSIYYSKKLHGDAMLKNLDPDNVSNLCPRYFRQAYKLLQSISALTNEDS